MEFYKPRELRGKLMQRIIRTRQVVGLEVRYPVGIFIPCLNENGHIEEDRLLAMGAPPEAVEWLKGLVEAK